MLYYGSLWLEKRYNGPTLIGFWLYYGDGSRREYMDQLDSDDYFMTAERDPAGNATTYTYFQSSYTHFLTRVTAADGTYFDVQHADTLDQDSTRSNITGVSSSYGASAAIGYGELDYAPDGIWSSTRVSSITDAAGIKSFLYAGLIGSSTIVTPYGTHAFDVEGLVDPDPTYYSDTFERYVNVTRPNNSHQLYAMMSKYTPPDWPNWDSGQIPDTSAAAVHTLDTTDRQGRNTFFWNAQQRAVMTKDPAVDTFAWADFKKGRIRHWLTTTIDGYAHWGTLSCPSRNTCKGRAWFGAHLHLRSPRARRRFGSVGGGRSVRGGSARKKRGQR